MSSRELDNLVRIGSLKVEPAEQVEFDGLVASGRARLKDARVKALAIESRFTLAYDAAHAFALAALRWHGYRPDRQRYVVFQALEHTLGLGPESWRVLAICHAKRNLVEYEGRLEVEDRLLADLLTITALLQENS
jgi:hypothetical protein